MGWCFDGRTHWLTKCYTNQAEKAPEHKLRWCLLAWLQPSACNNCVWWPPYPWLYDTAAEERLCTVVWRLRVPYKLENPSPLLFVSLSVEASPSRVCTDPCWVAPSEFPQFEQARSPRPLRAGGNFPSACIRCRSLINYISSRFTLFTTNWTHRLQDWYTSLWTYIDIDGLTNYPYKDLYINIFPAVHGVWHSGGFNKNWSPPDLTEQIAGLWTFPIPDRSSGWNRRWR